MAYYEFPHTKNFDTDVSFLINQYKELINKIDNIQTEILTSANNYTDAQIKIAFNDVNRLINEINENYSNFVDKINLDILLMQNAINEQNKNIDNKTSAIEQNVDFKIAQNNDYIFEQISKDLIDIKVINYFTGETTTIQNMFDYLAQFHVENAISYNELANRNKTYNQLRNLNITYTELAQNGGILI